MPLTAETEALLRRLPAYDEYILRLCFDLGAKQEIPVAHAGATLTPTAVRHSERQSALRKLRQVAMAEAREHAKTR